MKQGKNATSRRKFLKNIGGATAAALTASAIPAVRAAGTDTLQIALIGCGGRGTGAARDAMKTQRSRGPINLVAMADVFKSRLRASLRTINDRFESQIDVPEERQFIGFDANKKAMDCLNPGDIAIFATPPAFRWVFLKYAIEKGLNVFLEKPVTVDGPTSRRMFKLAEEASRKNLKVGVGLMVRHCRGRQELKKRVDDGEIGDIIAMRAYRMHQPVGSAFSDRWDKRTSEMLYQIRRFHSFLWASGGLFSDFYIHQIDECSWMKGSWPVKAHATGGRHYRGDKIDQNFDSYSVEYTYADGTKLFLDGRTMYGCHREMASYMHGTKGSGIVSFSGHTPGKVRTFKNQTYTGDPLWAYPQPERNPYELEWEDLVDAVRNNKPYNEVKRGAQASLVTSMGRMAAHTGQVITYDQILNGDHEFAPGLDKADDNFPAPLQAGPDGKYPIPEPGKKKEREY